MTVLATETNENGAPSLHRDNNDRRDATSGTNELTQRLVDSQLYDPLDELRRFIGPETFVLEGRVPLSAVQSSAIIRPDKSSDAAFINTSILMSAVPESRAVTKIAYLPPGVVIELLRQFGQTGDPSILSRATIAQSLKRQMWSSTEGEKLIFFFDTDTAPVAFDDPLLEVFSLSRDRSIRKEFLEVKKDKVTGLQTLILDKESFFQNRGSEMEHGMILPENLITSPFVNNPRIAIQAGFFELPLDDKRFIRDYFHFMRGLTRQLEQFAQALETGTIVNPEKYINALSKSAQKILIQDMGQRLQVILGHAQLLSYPIPEADKETSGVKIYNSMTTQRFLYKLLADLIHLEPVMQTVDMGVEIKGIGSILAMILNQSDDDGHVLREVTFDVAEDVELKTRAVPSIIAALFLNLVNHAIIDRAATRAHITASKQGQSIVLTLDTDMPANQVYPGLISKNIEFLLLIFSAMWNIPPTEVGNEKNGSTVSFVFPAVSNSLN